MKRTGFKSKAGVSAGARNLRLAPKSPSPESSPESAAHVASAAQGGDRMRASESQEDGSPRRAPADYSTLTRTTRVSPKRETERRSSRVHNEQHLDDCREAEGCYIKLELGDAIDDCWGGLDPDHQRDMTGAGMKSDDETCYPVCRNHHGQMERFAVPGATTRATRKAMRTRLADRFKADRARGYSLRESLPF